MTTIKYESRDGKKAVKKEIEIIEPKWDDWVESTELQMKIIRNTSKDDSYQFTDMSKFVMIYTGKTEEEMTDLKNKCDNNVLFINDIFSMFTAIVEYTTSKKK